MVLRRAIIVILGLLLQIGLTLFVYLFLVENILIIKMFYAAFGTIIVLFLIKNSKNFSYSLPWIVIILLFPIIGTLLYLILGRNKKRSKTLKRIVAEEENIKKYLIQDESIKNKCISNGKLNYISNYANYPVSTNNNVKYYSLGDYAFPQMLKELEKAKKFIFFEYFIVNHGKMWDSILEILERKAKEGVDVRVMYDDLGCLSSLDENYPKKLEEKGIKCVCFNRLNFIAGIIMNNRDHRKILIIDGKVAFSGGINISDEYINIGSKYGHWKDNAFKISGDGVWNYTVMFLTMWNSYIKEDADFTEYKYKFNNDKDTGFVAPYGETPLDDEVVGEDIYLNIINQAKKYVYILTPYLIIDTDMVKALTLASKRGVDVRIVIPGIPDKKIVYTLSESYIPPLLEAGVKVYKYSPGFVHSKVFVSDDNVATVGTINMDYRSLYLHFECGCYFEDCSVVKDIKKDVSETIDKSELISSGKVNIIKSLWQAILRLFAPLM